MTLGKVVLVFAHVRHDAKILARVRHYVQRFYGNCRALYSHLSVWCLQN